MNPRRFGFQVSSRMLLESFETLNHDFIRYHSNGNARCFTASYCHRILFIKDGKIFNELIRGNSTRKEFLIKSYRLSHY